MYDDYDSEYEVIYIKNARIHKSEIFIKRILEEEDRYKSISLKFDRIGTFGSNDIAFASVHHQRSVCYHYRRIVDFTIDELELL